jgi:preprotein translocase subunit SecG
MLDNEAVIEPLLDRFTNLLAVRFFRGSLLLSLFRWPSLTRQSRLTLSLAL